MRDPKNRGRQCYERREWADAYEALSLADRSAPLDVEDLERLAFSAGLTGRDDEFLKAHERLHQALLEQGETVRAIRSAFWLCMRLFALGEPGRASGWLGRAQHMLEREGDCVERGYLLLPLCHRHLHAGDFEAAYQHARAAAEVGDRFRDADLSAFACTLQGRVLVRQGQLERGLALLDEAMIATTTGELSPVITGLIYCSVIAACQQIYALDRAREWTAALTRWCQTQPQLVTFAGVCLVHRSEIMQLGGAWSEAAEEARRAFERFAPPADREGAADAAYQQAEILRLRGQLGAAEDAYRTANQLGREPQPGLALMRLCEGRADVAAGAIRSVLQTVRDPLQRVRFLPACVEIMLAASNIDEARAACEELESIAGRFEMEVLGAIAAHARGSVLLAEGDARAALDPLRRAFRVWQQVGAPYLAARLRLLLARACCALGDDEGATLELDAARTVFEQLGAAPDLAAIAAIASPAAPARGGDHGLTPRELQVLRLVASGKTNKAIARELFVSEKTIDRHVSNLFVKLDVSSRAAATAHAYEHGLMSQAGDRSRG